LEKLTSILVAVEEFARGALALDKAVTLARNFQARVNLLIADPALAGRFAAHCNARGYQESIQGHVHHGDESLQQRILRGVSESRPDLVVKAPLGEHPLRRWTLDNSDWQLAHECPVPILLVGGRPWANPPRFAAAVDVADEHAVTFARSILQAAGFLALGCRGHLDVLYSERERNDETLRMARAVKLAQLVREFHVGCERLQIFEGTPEKCLPPLIEARKYDIVVLGAVSHRAHGDRALESLSSRLVDAAEGDALLVKACEPVRPGANRSQRSAFQQASHEREQLV
jgi:nucleotide-binding universal stress UspA family protein